MLSRQCFHVNFFPRKYPHCKIEQFNSNSESNNKTLTSIKTICQLVKLTHASYFEKKVEILI